MQTVQSVMRCAWIVAVASLAPSGAAQFDPPADYYDTATGTGATLKENLRAIIFRDWRGGQGLNGPEHQFNSYGSAFDAFRVIDQDPNNPFRYLEVYTGQSVSSSPTREHTWPRSLGVGESFSSRAFTDLHMLRGLASNVNSSRSNSSFGEAQPLWDPDLMVGYGAQSFSQAPGTMVSYRGQMARMAFYMATRYEATDLDNPTQPDEPDTNDLEVTTASASSSLGDLDWLIRWHFENMPDDFERRRNHLVYSNYQGNRNPFVDHPEFAWTIFAESQIGADYGPNNAQLHLTTAQTPSGGTVDVEALGEYVRTPGTPASAVFELRKSNTHPTTYRLTETGDATVVRVTEDGEDDLSPQTQFQFGVGYDPQVIEIEVALADAAGVYEGTVVVDNTELTSSAGGRGSQDGDDTMFISGTAYDPSDLSLFPQLTLKSVSQGFTVPEDSGVQPLSFEVTNRAGDPVFTADADVDSGLASGAGAAFVSFNDAATPDVILPGQTVSVVFDVDTDAAPSNFSVTLQVFGSDQDIAMASAPSSDVITVNASVTLDGVVTLGCPGDTDGDLDCDPNDFVNVLVGFGTTSGATRADGDFDGDSDVDADDFIEVLVAFGAVYSPECSMLPF
ncbi:MAG: endonuclease [Planctomycetota bacterium]